MTETPELIYLASPLTHPDKEVVYSRYLAVLNYVGNFIKSKRVDAVLFSPIIHSYVIHERLELPGDFEYWKFQNECQIQHCDELWVLCLEGYETSKGIASEVEFAKSIGKLVRYLEVFHFCTKCNSNVSRFRDENYMSCDCSEEMVFHTDEGLHWNPPIHWEALTNPESCDKI